MFDTRLLQSPGKPRSHDNFPGQKADMYNSTNYDVAGDYVVFFLCFFFIQFNVPFKIISLIETSQSIGGAKREYPGKTT